MEEAGLPSPGNTIRKDANSVYDENSGGAEAVAGAKRGEFRKLSAVLGGTRRDSADARMRRLDYSAG